MIELFEFLPLLKEFGPLVMAVGFFIWRDWKREGHLMGRVTTLEKEQREVILPLVKETSEVIAENTAVMRDLKKMLEK